MTSALADARTRFVPSKSLVRRLAELARPNAVAVLEDGRIVIRLQSMRQTLNAPLRELDSTELKALIAAGWIEVRPGEAAGSWQLTELGRISLRQAVLTPAKRAAKSRTRKKRIEAIVAPAHRPTLLDILHARTDTAGAPLISTEQLAAAERLAADFQRAALQPRVTQSWDAAAYAARSGFSGHGGVGERDASAQAHLRVQKALEFAGSDLAGLLLDVCCFDVGLAQCERDRSWNEGTARILLRHGLQRLAEHYGLAVRRPPDLARYIRHWSDGDYRPGAERWTGA